MALYDDNTDRVVLTTIIDSLMARLDEKDKTIDSKDELISVKDSLLAAKDEIIKSLETNDAELTAAMANLKETLDSFFIMLILNPDATLGCINLLYLEVWTQTACKFGLYGLSGRNARIQREQTTVALLNGLHVTSKALVQNLVASNVDNDTEVLVLTVVVGNLGTRHPFIVLQYHECIGLQLLVVMLLGKACAFSLELQVEIVNDRLSRI